MSEEKIRNYKAPMTDVANSDSIPSFLLKTYEILEVNSYLIEEFKIQRHHLLDQKW